MHCVKNSIITRVIFHDLQSMLYIYFKSLHYSGNTIQEVALFVIKFPDEGCTDGNRY